MNRFIMMVGLPASGKDTWIENYIKMSKNKLTVVCPDDIRAELYGNRSVQGNASEVFARAFKQIKLAMSRGEDVIFNATNMRAKNRVTALDIAKQYKDYLIYAEIIATPLQQCLDNNKKRAKKDPNTFVPVDVIYRMYKYYEPPCYFEGFNKIEVNYPFMKPYVYFPDKSVELEKFDQDNPHHDYSLGAHMRIAAKKCKQDLKKGKIKIVPDNHPLKEYYEGVLLKAVSLHDIGKEYTKNYYDKKGFHTEWAHYYDHANIGAYEYMWYQLDKDYYSPYEEEFDPYIAAAIAYHMRPFQWKEEKTKEKYKKLWGEPFYNIIVALHEYDVKATKKD